LLGIPSSRHSARKCVRHSDRLPLCRALKKWGQYACTSTEVERRGESWQVPGCSDEVMKYKPRDLGQKLSSVIIDGCQVVYAVVNKLKLVTCCQCIMSRTRGSSFSRRRTCTRRVLYTRFFNKSMGVHTLITKDGNGSVGHGSFIGHIDHHFGWVTWAISHWVMGHYQ